MIDGDFYRRTRVCGDINGKNHPIGIYNIPNLVLWLCADNISGADGDAIGTWTDVSSLANSPTQATAGEKPTLKTNIVNGHSVARFDGGDSMDFATAIDPYHISIFSVLRPVDITHLYTVLCSSSSSAFQYNMDTNGKMALGKSAVAYFCTSTTSISKDNFNNVSATYDNPYAALRLAQAADGSATSVQSLNSINRLGERHDGYKWNGDIAELIVYSRLLTSTEISFVEQYLKGRYGV